jgi:hypothetical protein
MDIKRVIKLRTSQGLAKRIDFPKNFEELLQKAQTFIPLEDSTKRYQFMEEKANKEIINQEDFELMSKEYETEKTIKILVNIVDKEGEEKEEIPLSKIVTKDESDENNKINLITPIHDLNNKKEKKEEEEPDDKIKNDIKELVQSKMKDLEKNLIQDIYQSIKTQININEEKMTQSQIIQCQSEMIHKNVECDNCGMKNIKGIRYKCLHCQNFDLCSNCEEYCEHDPTHIMIKIRKPLKEEDELLMQMRREIKYKNNNFNYSVRNKDIKFKMETKDNYTLAQQITVENTGNESWKSGAVFKCLPDSQLHGKDMKIETKLNKNCTVNFDIIFENFKDSLKPSLNEYFVYYQMFNSNNEAFGNITKFRVLFQN